MAKKVRTLFLNLVGVLAVTLLYVSLLYLSEKTNLPSVSTSTSGQGMSAQDPPQTSIQETNQPASHKEAIDQEQRWAWILVNKNHKAPSEPVKTVEIEKIPVDIRIAPHLYNILKDAREKGINLGICSGYRSIEIQRRIFECSLQSCIAKYANQNEGEKQAMRNVAKPGYSEHNSGLAIDFFAFSNPAYNVDGEFPEKFEITPEGEFLKEHAPEYGFFLRYPKDKDEITGFNYEPWHFRYVGVPLARKVMDSGLTFDEYWESYLANIS